MPYYETDSRAIAWFERALSHGTPRIRRSALRLLEMVDCAHRSKWLGDAQADPSAEVAAYAILVEALLFAGVVPAMDLFESDFAFGIRGDDLHWEWEYELAIAHDVVLHGCTHRVWTAEEDDALARRLALHKAYVGKSQEVGSATALIVDKRLVNQYTRSPRTSAEARRWGQTGRPRYRE